ncbi:MAG: hypothetical protein JRI56_04670 [Deltaproteobacteria bacterium]|nr:hypothetical protein [Deltaproteobacteria bacterium]
MNRVEVNVGSLIEFLYVDAGNLNPFRRVRPASFKQGGVDLIKYEGLVRDAAGTVLSVFG